MLTLGENGKPTTLIETRGEGGFIVAPGSPCECHPSGKPYEHLDGPKLSQLPTITPEERQVLLRVARSFTEIADEPEFTTGKPPADRAESRPGDEFNDTATWEEILTPHGWTIDHRGDGKNYWRRPGKEGPGWSATTGLPSEHGNELFCVFSSNAHPFQGATGSHSCSTYNKFSAYTLLEHGGDFTAAARELGRKQSGGTNAGFGNTSASARRHCTDYGNAERFVDRHGTDARYCRKWGKWLVWDGRRWEIDEMGTAIRLAKHAVRGIYTEAAADPDEDKRKRLARWAYGSEHTARITAMLKLAESEPPVPLSVDSLDCDPWAFNCENGTIDLKTGELRTHRRGDFITKLAPVNYAEDGDDPVLWLSFLERIFDENLNLIAFVQRLVGSALVGEVIDHTLAILHGKGSNGKSVFIETMLGVFGDYGMKASQELLMATKHPQHPTERADLFGRRLVAAVESDDGRRLSESAVKEMTGGDTIPARHMRQDFFRFEPSHTALLVTNHKPKVFGTGHAIWRRICLVPFEVTIPDDEQDMQLGRKLRAEWGQILRWAVEGCLDWQRQGLNPPETVKKATAAYRSDEDILGDFLAERCEFEHRTEILAAELYRAYADWAEKNNDKPISQRAFGGRLSERGDIERVEKARPRKYRGIGLKSVPDASDASTRFP